MYNSTPTNTDEFEKVHGTLESQPKGSYIVDPEAYANTQIKTIKAIEDAILTSNMPKGDLWNDGLDGIVLGEE